MLYYRCKSAQMKALGFIPKFVSGGAVVSTETKFQSKTTWTHNQIIKTVVKYF